MQKGKNEERRNVEQTLKGRVGERSIEAERRTKMTEVKNKSQVKTAGCH